VNQEVELIEAFQQQAQRRKDRREFFKAFALTAVAGGGLAMATSVQRAAAQATLTDGDVLNFALNLEYLEAQFYAYAANGVGLSADLLTGSGKIGAAVGARQATFKDPAVAAYAQEIAADERAHVAFLRSAIGATAVGQPQIDIGVSPTSAFSNAARAAGLIGAGESFDPYASDENFLLGAFIFEDVGVTAYKGASPLITNKVFLEAAAGILAVEAYHAALVRTTLDAKGIAAPSLVDATEAISNARDSLDGASDDDQGIRAIGTSSNIAPLDANGLAYSRSTGQVLNIVYLNKAAVTAGGFFPNGVNGTIVTSAAN
jgi:hypothetical protein